MSKKLLFRNIYNKYGVLFILIVEIIIFSLANETFFTPSNILSVGRQFSFIGMSAIGMTMVMITGGIDISVCTMLAMSGVICAKLNVDAGLPIAVCIIITVILGAFFGLLNGLAVNFLKIPALIATLAMQTVLKGIAYLVTNAIPIKNISDSYKNIGQGYIFNVIPIPFVVMLVMYIIAWWYLDKTYMGRHIYLVGGNEEAARLSGINTKLVGVSVYVFCGLFTSVAGLMMAARLGSGQPSVGTGFEMDVITATVLGGVSVSGGKGNVINVLFGACIMGFLANGMTILNVNQYWQWIVNGIVLVAAVATSTMMKDK